MPLDASFPFALYYPTIELRESRWLKAAALYWDGFYRIVPATDREAFTQHDDAFVRELVDGERGFLKEIVVSESDPAVKAAGSHMESILDNDGLADIVEAIDRSHVIERGDASVEIFHQKMPSRLRDLLETNGLAAFAELGVETLSVAPSAALVYMTILAGELAARRQLPVITDDGACADLLRSSWLRRRYDERTDESDPSTMRARASAPEISGVLSMFAVEQVLPVRTELRLISADRLLDFRRKYAHERRDFFRVLNTAVDDIVALGIADTGATRDRVEHFGRQLAECNEALSNAYRADGIKTTRQILSLDGKVPLAAFATGVAGYSVVNPIMGIGFCVGMIGVLTDRAVRRRNLARDSPSAYLTHVGAKFGDQGVMRRLFEMKVRRTILSG